MRLFFIDKEDFIERFWLFISIGIENSVKKLVLLLKNLHESIKDDGSLLYWLGFLIV